MIYKVFKATLEYSVKNDFVKTCEKFLEKLDLEITFEEIAKMNTNKFKKLLKEKTMEAVFKYLIEEKNKQKKMCDIEYKGWK